MKQALVLLAIAIALLAPRVSLADETANKEVTCEETIPKGAKRPKVKEKFPGEVIAGFGAALELEIRHGKGETPLPNGFKIVSGSNQGKFLEDAGFLLAEANGGPPVVVETKEEDNVSITKVSIPFVVAPLKSGNLSQQLPRMPFNVGRANGETMTLCTQVHLVTVLDPTAAEEEPMPRANPAPRPQREPWPLIKYLLAAAVALLIISIVVTWWVVRQVRKPIPQPLTEARLPWEQALTELQALATSPLLDGGSEQERGEYFDKVSDTLRKYLGARYGFVDVGIDGLETTTDEMMKLLRRVRPGVPRIDLIHEFLRESDLVKFARVVPEISECKVAVQRAEVVIKTTTPVRVAAGTVDISGPRPPTVGQSPFSVTPMPPAAGPAEPAPWAKPPEGPPPS